MNPATMRLLTREAYDRLLSHACRETDFAYIGSVGGGPARGEFSGFSANAVETRTYRYPEHEDLSIDGLARDLEGLINRYGIETGNKQQCLTGGWIGFISYEFGYARESRLKEICPLMRLPLLSSGLYLWAASYNRSTDHYWLWVHPECPEETRKRLEHWLTSEETTARTGWSLTSAFEPKQRADAFKRSVEAIRNYIEAGDCYQANLSQEFSAGFRGDPWQAFQALSLENPTPYAAFIRTDNNSIISVSPERFLEIHGRTVTTSPIKGTRPRGSDPAEDKALAAELEASEKDRAENLMIVDLLRNDLGLNAKPASVMVDKLFALESYRNVHHLVSHIRAELADGVSPMKALFDAFPGGSITGAPKIRAMEIIRELEPHWRGPYCGSIFYRGLDGTLDSNIAIRTMLCDGEGTIRCWGGGGIVADSDPEAEYQETLAKVGPLMRFLEELVIE